MRCSSHLGMCPQPIPTGPIQAPSKTVAPQCITDVGSIGSPPFKSVLDNP